MLTLITQVPIQAFVNCNDYSTYINIRHHLLYVNIVCNEHPIEINSSPFYLGPLKAVCMHINVYLRLKFVTRVNYSVKYI